MQIGPTRHALVGRRCPHQRQHLIIDSEARLSAVYQYKLLVAVRSFRLNYHGPVPEESTAQRPTTKFAPASKA